MYNNTMKEIYIYNLNDIGILVAEERKKRGYTQEVFSSMLGVSHATLSKLENGNSVNANIIEKALQILGKQIIIREKGNQWKL